MKRLILLLIIPFIGTVQILAQDKNPDEKTIVNKKYDENGNLIQYDSTYVHQWSSDSAFHFPFDDKFAPGIGFPDLNDLLKELFGDSVQTELGMHQPFSFSPFGDEDFLGNFGHHFKDSLFIGNFPFDRDSLFKPFDFKNQFPSTSDLKDWDEIRNQLVFPEFKTPEQKEEWEKLMQKHQQEKEELLKKWKK